MSKGNQENSQREKKDRKKAEELLKITEEAERKKRQQREQKLREVKEREKAADLLRKIEEKSKEKNNRKNWNNSTGPKSKTRSKKSDFENNTNNIKNKNFLVEIFGKIGEADGLGEFSFKKFFGGINVKHSEEEFVKNIFVGTKETTPSIKEISSKYPQPWIFSRLLIAALVIFYAFKFAYDHSPNPIYIPALIVTGSFGIPLSTL